MKTGQGEFNVLVAGVGGQGVLTLATIVADAAFRAGFDVKTTEIHGLSQRYGSVPVHIRFGSRIRSPALAEGSADVIVALEPLEALKSAVYGSREKTVVVIDDYRVVPIGSYLDHRRYPSNREIRKFMAGFAKEVVFLDASGEALEATKDRVLANIFILGYLVGSRSLPLPEGDVLASVKEHVPARFWDTNLRVFRLGSDAGGARQTSPTVR